MIVEMKKAYVVVETAKKRSMLKALGKAGLLHLESEAFTNEETQQIQKRCDTLSSVISLIGELHGKNEKREQQKLSPEASAEVTDRYVQLVEEKKRLEEEIIALRAQAEELAPWGDFDPSEIAALKQHGIDLRFYTISKKDLDRKSVV